MRSPRSTRARNSGRCCLRWVTLTSAMTCSKCTDEMYIYVWGVSTAVMARMREGSVLTDAIAATVNRTPCLSSNGRLYSGAIVEETPRYHSVAAFPRAAGMSVTSLKLPNASRSVFNRLWLALAAAPMHSWSKRIERATQAEELQRRFGEDVAAAE